MTLEQVWDTPQQDIGALLLSFEPDPEIEREHRHRQRLSDCGRPASRIDPHTSKPYWFTKKCELYRECPKCLHDRAMEQKERLQLAVAKGKNVSLLTVSDKEGKSIARKLNRTQYARFPQDNDTEILFVEDGLVNYNGKSMSLGAVNELDWESIVLSPEGRNKSGTLGSEFEKSESDEIFEFISSPSIVSDAPAEEQGIAHEIAEFETPNMNPTTAKEVEDCIQTRMWTVYRILKAKGYNPRMYWGLVKVYESKILWSNNYVAKRKKQHKEAYSQLEMPIIH